MRGIWGIEPAWGVTVVRIAMALILIHAGWVKWFQWGVTTGVASSLDKYGIPAPIASAYLISTLELVGGLALLVGLFTRWLGLLYAIQFAVALFYVKLRPQGFMPGWVDLMLLAGGLLFFLAGPGRASVDEVWLEREEPARRMRQRAA